MKTLNLSNVKWGDIYMCDLGKNNGSVQSGVRPVLVIQNNIGNMNSPTIAVAPITSILKKLTQPTHILLDTSCGLKKDSMVMLEQVCTVDKRIALIEYVGYVKDKKAIYNIQQGLLVQFGIVYKKQPDRSALILSLCPKCKTEFETIPDNIVRRVDPLKSEKERCDKCQVNFGYEYLILKKRTKSYSLGTERNEKSD